MSLHVTRTLEDEVGQCLLDLGIGATAWVPGLGATGCAEAYAAISGRAVPPSFHEEVAVGCAHGAALAGTRSAVLMKAHGLFKAANAVSDALFCRTTAAFVLVLVDDAAGTQSDSIVAAGPVLDALELPWCGSGPATFGRDFRETVARSERLGIPAGIVIDAADTMAPAVAAGCHPPVPPPPAYRRDPARHLLVPALVRHQRAVLSARLAGAELPPPPPLPRLPDGVPPRWRPLLARYAPLFRSFVARRPSFVAGDIGISSCYGLPPVDAIDVVTYMGGALPLAIGAHLAGRTDAWAVTDDFSFVSAGQLGLLETLVREVPLRVLLLANGRAETTGGQPVATALLDRVLAGYAEAVVPLDDPLDESACAAALEEARARDGLAVVVARYPLP